MKIKELLTDESKWCQHVPAVDAKGNFVYPEDKRAARWCLVGAVQKCYGPGSGVSRRLLARLAAELHEHPHVWNDKNERTFADVQALINRLDI